MSTLSREFRRQLESTVLKARDEAERGAAAALESFGVADAKLPGHLDDAGKILRRKLRAHGRQVGDVRRPDDSQEVTHLVHECAYEHWHRMLFARFLAENGFLIEPESGLDVDFAHCEEEGRRLGIDPWEVAARFAQRMLPGIFRSDDPVLQLRLPAETRNALTALLASLPREVFLADDSLGWVYQFWQAKKKKDVNDSGEKIGADELPAVTQLFTEDYMVEFLLHNTLGAWWTTKRRAEGKNQPIAFNYLRLKKDGKPAAGAFDEWPKMVKELRVLDPCMGSGHFLVFALVILLKMRMEEEGLSARDACVAVLRDNLFGLELDPRCTQIAAFNLALAAWKLGGYQKELPLNLACSGLGLNTKKDEWVKLAEGNPNLRFAMGALYDLFQKAPVLGSLINPRRDKSVTYATTLQELQPLFQQALQREKTDEGHELAVTAQGVAKAAEILAGQFSLVATNVPYLGLRKQGPLLRDFCVEQFPQSKHDLACVFIERCLQFVNKSCCIALVTPRSWTFKDYFDELRESLLKTTTINILAILGPGAFETISGEVVDVALFATQYLHPSNQSEFYAIDLSETTETKSGLLKTSELVSVNQLEQLKNPDHRISVHNLHGDKLLEEYAIIPQGIKTGDDGKWIMHFWELCSVSNGWDFCQSSSAETTDFGGRECVIDWRTRGIGMIRPRLDSPAVGKYGVGVSQTGECRLSIYTGQRFDSKVAPIVPNKKNELLAIWTFCSSKEYSDLLTKLSPGLFTTNSAFLKVPFDLARWQKLAAEKYPDGLPKPFSSDPTQWLFNGHPKGADHPLHVAVARLVGYRWPRQMGSSFLDCPALGTDGLEKHADDDGVVCFSQARDEAPAAARLRALLADAYGKEWTHAMERKLITATGSDAESLEEWLVNDFFAQHCDLFHNRPFVWHIWDGRKDGFNVLVNYHKLAGPKGEGHRTLETLAYAYLGDWIARQKDAVAHNEAGADDRLAAANELQGELKKILAGEPPYDLFIRWKPLHQQPIGWEADINDGVRLNIRPFMVAKLSRGRTGCGLFRAKPNNRVNWDKDRGKEPLRLESDYPWFWKWDEQAMNFFGNGEFDGNRWNGCHYTAKFKRQAREKKGIKT